MRSIQNVRLIVGWRVCVRVAVVIISNIELDKAKAGRCWQLLRSEANEEELEVG